MLRKVALAELALASDDAEGFFELKLVSIGLEVGRAISIDSA
jgi:hypothetical protein